jgi:hypothetical protein
MTDARPSCKQFRPHLLAVLAELAGGKAGVQVEMTLTYGPVCKRLGHAEDAFGNSAHGTLWTHRQIGLAMRALRRAGFTDSKRKAQWELTEMGLRAMKNDFAGVLDEPDLPEEEEDYIAPVIHLPMVASPYDESSYLRALAVQQTPCFGAYSAKSNVCDGCLLASACVSALEARFAEVAAEIEREEARANVAARTQQRAKADQDVSVDELLRMEDVKTVAARATTGIQPVDANVSSPRDTVCTRCKKTIPKGTNAVWTPGGGMEHTTCPTK